MAVRQRRKGQAKVDSGKKGESSAMSPKEQEQDDHAAITASTLASTASTRKWSLTAIIVAAVIGVVVACAVVIPRDENTGVKSSAAAESGTTSTPSASPTKQQQQQQQQQQQDNAGKPTDSPTDSPTAGPLFTNMGTYELLETVPHDATAFTQGLELINSTHYYESTGLYGQSEVRIVDIQTGEVMDRHVMDAKYFGEGLCYYTDRSGQGRLMQLTYHALTGIIYDAKTLEVLDMFPYSTTTSEGWGITFQAKSREFLVSDGSEYLVTWSMKTLEETTRVPVSFQRRDMAEAKILTNINELEWDPFHSDTVMANVWYQDVILRIDIATGFVTKTYNLQSLFPNKPASADVLNGIAVTSVANEVWVTGKLWPNMFRIRLVD